MAQIMKIGHMCGTEANLGLQYAVWCRNGPNIVISRSKFALNLKKIMRKDCIISFEVFLLCCTLAQSTILSLKMVFKMFQGRKFGLKA